MAKLAVSMVWSRPRHLMSRQTRSFRTAQFRDVVASAQCLASCALGCGLRSIGGVRSSVRQVPHPADFVLHPETKTTESRFCYDWTITQLVEGYRYNADDVLCAHFALRERPAARRLLDLGSGLGSIGLLWLGQRPNAMSAKCTMLEAQPASVELCRQTLRRCGAEAMVDLRNVDLRDAAAYADLTGGFDVVTANPPYMSASIGALPRNPQRAFCRHELRGGMTEFCQAAAGQLASGGCFCMVHTAQRAADAATTLAATGFVVQKRVGVILRGERKSVVFVCIRSDSDAVPVVDENIVVAEHDGSPAPEYLAICSGLGL